jgi:hypothetical protein
MEERKKARKLQVVSDTIFIKRKKITALYFSRQCPLVLVLKVDWRQCGVM